MKKIIKTDLLAAMKNVLQEYRERQHTLKKSDCALCKLYYNVKDFETCEPCPMNIFPSDFLEHNLVGCLDRKCRPVNCREIDYDSPKLKAVIEFYEQAILKVEDMKERIMNKKDAFKFLIDIDKEIAIKHGFIFIDF